MVPNGRYVIPLRVIIFAARVELAKETALKTKEVQPGKTREEVRVVAVIQALPLPGIQGVLMTHDQGTPLIVIRGWNAEP